VDISSSTALITGGASGLGAATAAHLVKSGAQVVLLDLPTSAGARVAADLGPRARFAAADVRDEAAIRAALAVVRDDLRSRLDIVVNCAGVGGPARVIGRSGPMDLEHFRRIITINLIGTFNVIRLAAAQMADQEPVGEERGVIVNTASIAAFEGQIGQASYAASKGGIVSMTLPIARDLASLKIRCVTIAPGMFETPLLAGASSETRALLNQVTVNPKRLGEPPEFARLVAQIVENPMLNGTTIRLDGGVRLPPR
jgi:NAD(P)-dependent dehydrogenase (short-subunit alcohol dehydrogenase family)